MDLTNFVTAAAAKASGNQNTTTPSAKENPVAPKDIAAPPLSENVIPTEALSEIPKGFENDEKFAIIARSEKRIREQQNKLKEEQKAFQKQQEEAREALEFFKKFKEDKYGAIKDHVNFEELSDRRLKELEEEENPLQRDVRELKSKYEEDLAFRQKELETQREERLKHYLGNLDRFIQTKSEQFPLVAADKEEAAQAVYDVMDAYFKDTGKTLSEEEALGHLEDTIVNKLKITLQSEHVRKKLGLADNIPDNQVKTPPTQPVAKSQGNFSLDNSFPSSTAPDVPLETMSSEERRKLAIEQMKGWSKK